MKHTGIPHNFTDHVINLTRNDVELAFMNYICNDHFILQEKSGVPFTVPPAGSAKLTFRQDAAGKMVVDISWREKHK